MDAVKFIKTKNRLCKIYAGPCTCKGCPIEETKLGKGMLCYEFINKYPEESVDIIDEWCDEHPIVTNLDKFVEIFGSSEAVSAAPSWWDKEYEEPKKENNNGKI